MPAALPRIALSVALTYSHDGIVGSQWVTPAQGLDQTYDPPSRLPALAAGPRQRVLDFELQSPLELDLAPPAVSILARSTSPAANTYTYAPLVTMTAPSRADFRAQTQLVRNYADLRTERIPEIIAQSEDMISFFGAIEYIDRNRAKWTIELIEASVRLAVIVEQRIKHALNCPRAMLFSDQIQPIIQTPGHGALPSGHATEAFTIATVLTHLLETADAVNQNASTASPASERLLHRPELRDPLADQGRRPNPALPASLRGSR